MKKIVLIIFGYILLISNSFALEERPEEITFGASIPNFKTVNGLGTAINLINFTFVSHGGDQSHKIDSLTPAISAKFFNEQGNGGFELNILNGANSSSVTLDGTVGSANFLDVIPITGVASPGAYRTGVVGTLNVKQEINMFNIVSFKKLDSIPENFTFLEKFNPEIGLMINRTSYEISVDDTFASSSLYHLGETVTSKSLGPVLSLYKEKKLNDINTKLILGSKLALLATTETLNADQNRSTSNNYNVTDKYDHLSGRLKLTAGFIKKTEQGSNFYIIGAVDIANDVSSIENPRCVAGQDCNSAEYAGTATPAHLKRQTTLSPSFMIGYKKTF
jgi:hypothetical protein